MRGRREQKKSGYINELGGAVGMVRCQGEKAEAAKWKE